jgi:hypothetical protein
LAVSIFNLLIIKDTSRLFSIDNPEFLSNIPKRKEVFTAETKNKAEYEWVKVRTYPKLIDGKWAFETLYKKVYH